MNEDGFAALAARSVRVRTEHRMLLQGLMAFQRRLQELVDGLSIRVYSKSPRGIAGSDRPGCPLNERGDVVRMIHVAFRLPSNRCTPTSAISSVFKGS